MLKEMKVDVSSVPVNLKKTKASKGKMRFKNDLEYIFMSLPAILLVFVFSYIPMFGVIIAFKNYRYDLGIIGSKWVGLKNFEYFFKSNDAWRIASNTIVLNTIFIIVGLVSSVIFALLLFEIKNRIFIKTYQTVMILPHFLSWVVVGYIAYAFLNPSYGFINSALRGMGIPAIEWYSEPKFWPVILTLTSVWKHVGMSCIIYYAGLMGIDSEYFEAAELDGATKIQMMWHISIPSIKSLMIITTILALGNIFRADFGLFFQMTRDIGALYPTTDVIDTYVFRALRSVGDVGMSSAVGLFQSIVGFITINVANSIVKKLQSDSALF